MFQLHNLREFNKRQRIKYAYNVEKPQYPGADKLLSPVGLKALENKQVPEPKEVSCVERTGQSLQSGLQPGTQPDLTHGAGPPKS